MSKQSEPMRSPDWTTPGLLRSASLNKERHDWQERRTTPELLSVGGIQFTRRRKRGGKESTATLTHSQ